MGARDPIIPVNHGRRAYEAAAGSCLAIFDEVVHMPQLEAPARFVAVLGRVIEHTEPGPFDAVEWRARFPTTGESPRAHGVRRAAG